MVEQHSLMVKWICLKKGWKLQNSKTLEEGGGCCDDEMLGGAVHEVKVTGASQLSNIT